MSATTPTDAPAAAFAFEECRYEDVAHFRAAAARERTAVAPSHNTRWFRADDAACAGLIFFGTTARIKGVYVRPNQRGRGLGTRLTERLIEVAAGTGCAAIEAFAWNPDFYAARGFAVLGRNKHGATRVRKVLKK